MVADARPETAVPRNADDRPGTEFGSINVGYDSVFRPGQLSVGLVVPLEDYPSTSMPSLERHLERAQLAEELGFSALWLRDVPFHVPSFGDAGQLFDPLVYLGFLAGRTQRIALGVASLVLPLRHPVHVAKAAASVDVLSGGRLILGVASGDRPEEYPAMALPFEERGASFRASYDYIRSMADSFPVFENAYGSTKGAIDMLPKPAGARLPLLVTGGSQQDADWLARHGDGWMVYPRDTATQARVIGRWRARLAAAGRTDKPVMQPLYVDLADDPDAPPMPIHLGFRLGARPLVEHLRSLRHVGVNHVALNLRFQRGDVEAALRRLAREVLPELEHGHEDVMAQGITDA